MSDDPRVITETDLVDTERDELSRWRVCRKCWVPRPVLDDCLTDFCFYCGNAFD